MEKEYIKKVLEHVKWKKSEGRKILGIAKSTLYKKIEDYKIQKM
jgi:DNA-binding NtrC family response regulator